MRRQIRPRFAGFFTLAIALALVFAAQNVFADNHLTAKDYVQSGLLLQFDGIATMAGAQSRATSMPRHRRLRKSL